MLADIRWPEEGRAFNAPPISFCYDLPWFYDAIIVDAKRPLFVWMRVVWASKARFFRVVSLHYLCVHVTIVSIALPEAPRKVFRVASSCTVLTEFLYVLYF